MNRIRAAWLGAAMTCAWSMPAAGQKPHLSGAVTLDPPAGLISARVCVSRFAPRRDLRFILTAGANLAGIADSAGRPLSYRGDYAGRMVGEALEYVVNQPDSTRPLGALCVTYRSAVPPFDSNTATTDWKGRITSMGGVLRASEQSRWYPTLHDSATGRNEQEVSYDLAVECPRCRGLYVNGARPVAGPSGRFVSAVPRGVLLLAGDFAFQETPELTFVAGPAGPDAVQAFSAAIRELSHYYAGLLGTPYQERPVLLTFRSVWSLRPAGVPSWQFVTWPTIAMSGGIAFDQVLERRGNVEEIPRWLWTTLSHEMGHYYFGTLLDPVGPLRWFVLESTAEYLSLRAVRAIRGEAAGLARALALLQGMGTVTLPTLDAIRRPDDISGTWRYQYAPAFLLALGRRQGEDRVVEMLRHLLATPAGTVIDFERLAAAAEQAGLPRAALTEGWRVEEIRATLLEGTLPALARAAADPASTGDAIDIATQLLNLDTTRTARLGVRDQLRRIVRRDSLQLRAHYQLGRIGVLTGQDLDRAVASLELYLRHPAPSHAAAHWLIGQIEEQRGRPEAARQAYRAALASDSTFARAREALERLPR